MNITGQRFAKILILVCMAQMLLGCADLFLTTTPDPAAAGNSESSNSDYADAQATINAGQGQLSDLSRQSTEVSLNMTQAAKAAAQSTQDDNQRQKMDLDFQATAVSLNIAQAAATQQSLKQQTKNVSDATAAVLSSAAVATQFAYQVNVTQTAHAQVILDAQTAQARADLDAQTAQAQVDLDAQALQNVTQTAQAQELLDAQVLQTDQAVVALTVYPLTATPFAETQAAVLMEQYGREQQSFVDRVVTPMIPVVATLVLLLFILVIIVAYRRFLPPRLLSGRANITPNPLMMIDGVAADRVTPHIIPLELTPANPPRLPGENKPQVEMVGAAEPPVAHWITEVEGQLAAEGRLLP